MSEQYAVYRLQHVLQYLNGEYWRVAFLEGRGSQRSLDLTDAAIIVNAKLATIELERAYPGEYR